MAINIKQFPSVSAATFAARRAEFLRQLRQGVAIFCSAPEVTRSNTIHYPYRQNSDFYYLTGFGEPGAVALLRPEAPAEEQYILFVRPRHKEREIWDGRRAGPEGAVRDYGANVAHSVDELDARLAGYLEKTTTIYYSLGDNHDSDRRIVDLLRQFRQQRPRQGKGPYQVVDPSPILHEMRLVKCVADPALMRYAAQISAQAHTIAMQRVQPGMYEFELAALIEQHFKQHGAAAPAYNTIVGGGANATILHYVENNCSLKAEDLVLIDAGAEYQHYCADITRTYPVSGRFSTPQAAVYQIVLDAQQAAIAGVRPGANFDSLTAIVLEILVQGLVDLGLLTGDVPTLIAEGHYRRFFMHRLGHWLGGDVHDVGSYVAADLTARPLLPGMVLTIEPGLYIEDAPDIPAAYRNIGVRIEDDVLVTAQGAEVLTAQAPKDIASLEKLIGH
jgi:Xaa-Pro aminopeptidase